MNRAIPARRKKFEELAARAFEGHEIERLPDGRWRCGPKHSWFDGYYVVFFPYSIIVFGDITDIIFHVKDPDSVGWAMRSIDDLDYVLGKVAPNMREEEFVGARVIEVLAEHRARISDAAFDKEERKKEREKLREMIEEVRCGDCGTADAFQSMFYEYTDDPDAPTVTDHAPATLWAYHALRWLVKSKGEELR